jgi:hypothetical protein
VKRSKQDTGWSAEKAATLAQISRIITSTPTIEEVYHLFAEQVRRIIPFDRIAINLVNTETGMASPRSLLPAYRSRAGSPAMSSLWPGRPPSWRSNPKKAS